MNTGTPNAIKLVSKYYLASNGIVGWLAWIIQQIIVFYGNKIAKEGLAQADEIHMVIVVNGEVQVFNKANNSAWSQVKPGQVLTKEEADAINKPVIDALVKLGSFNKLRKPS